MNGKIVNILSASKGEGKTSFLCEYATIESGRGRSVGGIASLAVFDGDRRIGYDLLDLRHNRRRVLARTDSSPAAGPTTGAYVFDRAAIATGNTAVISAVRDGLDIVAIDEIGPLEFRGEGWAPGLTFALQQCTSEQELIVTVRPSLLDKLANRFPSPVWSSATVVSPPWPSLTQV